jgi:hypothetical protein
MKYFDGDREEREASRMIVHPPKIKLKLITIDRAEGPTALCGTKTVTTWDDAQHIIFVNAQTAPETGGYDKHDVTIEWENGSTFKFRLDVQGPNSEHGVTSLVDELNQMARCYSGRHKPSHLSDAQYKTILSYGRPNPAFYCDLLDNYDLGQMVAVNVCATGGQGISELGFKRKD